VLATLLSFVGVWLVVICTPCPDTALTCAFYVPSAGAAGIDGWPLCSIGVGRSGGGGAGRSGGRGGCS